MGAISRLNAAANMQSAMELEKQTKILEAQHRAAVREAAGRPEGFSRAEKAQMKAEAKAAYKAASKAANKLKLRDSMRATMDAYDAYRAELERIKYL